MKAAFQICVNLCGTVLHPTWTTSRERDWILFDRRNNVELLEVCIIPFASENPSRRYIRPTNLLLKQRELYAKIMDVVVSRPLLNSEHFVNIVSGMYQLQTFFSIE